MLCCFERLPQLIGAATVALFIISRQIVARLCCIAYVVIMACPLPCRNLNVIPPFLLRAGSGSYCTGPDKRQACPGGTFGAPGALLTSAACSGQCVAGYFCTEGSTSSTASQCGGVDKYCPQGSASPQPVSDGFFSTPVNGPPNLVRHVTLSFPRSCLALKHLRCSLCTRGAASAERADKAVARRSSRLLPTECSCFCFTPSVRLSSFVCLPLAFAVRPSVRPSLRRQRTGVAACPANRECVGGIIKPGLDISTDCSGGRMSMILPETTVGVPIGLVIRYT